MDIDLFRSARLAIMERIRTEGVALPGGFLRVDGFLNHRIDPSFIGLAGAALARAFAPLQPTCVFTAEASGNVIAYETARVLGAKALYAKKGTAHTMARPRTMRAPSPTRGRDADLCVSENYLPPAERVLVVDDFLHRGTTSAALAQLALDCGADLVGFGFVIEKIASGGRTLLESFRVPIVSLARVELVDHDTGTITFAEP